MDSTFPLATCQRMIESISQAEVIVRLNAFAHPRLNLRRTDLAMPQSAPHHVEIASFLVEPGDECVPEAVELEPAVNGFFHGHGFFHGQ